MAKDIFQDTGNPDDVALGNDFLDFDDVNQNDDFSDKEKNIAADGYNQEPGEIDKQTGAHEFQHNMNPGFSDFDVMNDDNLDPDMFPTGQDILEQAQGFKSAASEQAPEKAPEKENEELLASVNKKFNTNFKTEKEFNDFLSKTNEKQFEEESTISDKDQQLYERNEGSIKYLESLLNKSDEELIKEHNIIQFFQKNNRKPEEADLQLIDEQIERMKDNVVLNLNADNVRNKYAAQKNELQSFNVKIDDKKQQAAIAKQKHNQSKLLDSYKNLYLSEEGNFMGAQLSKEDLQASFNDVKSGEFVKRILADPNKLATLSLVERKLKEIQAASSRPGYSDGINAIFDKSTSNGKRMGSNARSSQTFSGNKSNSKDSDFLL